jgi:hypothetical protein
MSPELALLIVSNVFLAAAFVVLHRWVRLRYAPHTLGPDPSPPTPFPGGEREERLAEWVLLAFAIFPTTFFFRMAYTESLFFLLAVLVLLGMQQRWPLLVIALIAGLATATRPVGVALVPAFALYLWQRSAEPPQPHPPLPPLSKGGTEAPSRLSKWGGRMSAGRRVRSFLLEAVALLPLSCWGLLAYMAFQAGAFDDPLAFARTQEHWRYPVRDPGIDKATSLLTLEPLWNLYVPSSPRYWERIEGHGNIVFSMAAANPVYFVLTIGLVVLGAIKRWFNGVEVVLAAGLLLIPYLTRGYEMSMSSMGRFMAVTPFLFVALGMLASGAPRCLSASAALLSAFLLVAYASLFAAGYRIF